MYWNKNEVNKNKDKVKKIFFFRICGTGMGAAACLLREKGYEVEGADLNFYPPMSDYLERMKIPCHDLEKVTKETLEKFDLVVVGNVVPKGSEHAKLIESLDCAYTSFPAALGALVLNECNVVGISGTHGKTTTTYLCTQVFEKLGENPGYFIGGVMDDRPSSRLGDGKYFFIESDEYDCAYFEKFSKFVQYEINNLVITSLEFDHADIFDTLEDIKDQFRKVIPELKNPIIANESYQAIVDLKNEYPENNWINYRPIIKKSNKEKTQFALQIKGQEVDFETNLLGEHNILNLSVVITFALKEGFDLEKIKTAVKNLNMVKRRQELRGFYKGTAVIDDFAHHPRSVELTIKAIKDRYPHKEVIVVFEPNSATARSSLFFEEFCQSLAFADHVILGKPQRKSSIKNHGDFDVDLAAKKINTEEVEAVHSLPELLHRLDELAHPARVFLILSNGTCLGLWNSSFVQDIDRVESGEQTL